jgi:predicted amidohydrolase YtcJ
MHVDAHAHLLQQGYKMQLQLDNAKSVQEVIERIKAYILAHPDVHADTSRWIEGMGWDQTRWESAEFPTAVGHMSLRTPRANSRTDGPVARSLASGAVYTALPRRRARGVGVGTASSTNIIFVPSIDSWTLASLS